MRRPAALLLSLALIATACTTPSADTSTSTSTTTTAPPPVTTTPEPATTTTLPAPQLRPVGLRPLDPFATFEEIPLLVDEPPYAGPPTPTSLDGVLWADTSYLSDEERAKLAELGFVVVPKRHSQFHEAYSHVEMGLRQPVYVTTDAAYHYWHLVFAKALKDTERDMLLPVLERFAAGLLQAATDQATELAGTELDEPAERVRRFARLLTALLETGDPPYEAEVEAELALIRDHLDFETSPTTGALVDYSLFRPRGHYTTDPALTRFFLAMSSLGLTAFGLPGQTGYREDPGTDELRTGLLLSRVLASDPVLVADWETIYEPTAFLVGLADDYTPFEAFDAAGAAVSCWPADPSGIAGDDAIADVAAALRASRTIGIDSEYASVRVMGVRFVLDSFIIDQLVDPNVAGRMEASPLDVAAAFGSEWARGAQDAAGVFAAYPGYGPQLEAMERMVAERPISAWASTVYDAWLYALQPSWSRHGEAYPDMMRTEAWAAKAHQAGFGSYTELKHDTILYAKQGFAEGETPVPPAEPRHWVEPDPVVYERLAAAAGLLRTGLADRDLLDPAVADVLDQLTSMYERFARLARDELAGRRITAEDNEWLETIGPRFELLWYLTADTAPEGGGGFADTPNDMAAVVADIMSNPERALEIGTGFIDGIYVLVPNDDGVFQVARGGVYSYYEFWVPRGERMTDEEWREMVAAGTTPDRPAWSEVFLAEP
jgi:hypothetical protein